ncbi:MAG: ATP-dependent Clp protease ATP-binding subunit [Thermoflexales bacterium]
MANLNSDLLDTNTRLILDRAGEIMRTWGKPSLMPEMALIAALRLPETTACRALTRLADQRAFKLKDLEAEAERQARARNARSANFTYVSAQNVVSDLTEEMLIVLDEARSIALATGEIYIATEHLLSSLAQPGVSTAGLLQSRGVTPPAIAALMAEGLVTRSATSHDWVAAARKGQAPPMLMREDLLRDLASLLALSEDRHVILTGAPGSGRRSLVQSLALLIAEGKGPAGVSAIVEISDGAWLDNPTLALQVALRQASGGAVFIANIHRFFASGGRPEAAARDLQKAFVGDPAAPIIIGTTTEADFNDRIKPNSLITQRSHLLRVPPMTAKEAEAALGVMRAQFERDYGLTVSPDAARQAAGLAARYSSAEALPGAAVRVLHRACALRKSNGAAPSAAPIGADDVTRAVSVMTGIPITKLGADERARYATMENALRQRILGQDEAVRSVSRAVKSARVGLKDPKRPIGSFLFLGPSGVGKSELARALAEFMFGSENNLIALDMTEYQKDDTINRLIGSPPGYVGYEAGGQLTEKVIKQPYSVVLFDEVEKAHPRILDILLQIMEEGRLTDGQGRLANFAEAVILLTSNLGAAYLNNPANLEDADLNTKAREMALNDVKGFFRPEFLNRLDDIITFNPLPATVMRGILDLLIGKEAKLASERGIAIEVTPAARAWLLAQNKEVGMGARPLRRILQRSVREKLTDYLLTLESPPAKVLVDAGADGLVFKA